MNCHRVPKMLQEVETTLDVAYLLDLYTRRHSAKLAASFPMAVPPAR